MNAPKLQRTVLLAWAFLFCLCFPKFARAQTPAVSLAADLPALRVAVSAINQSRNSEGRGTISLTLSIGGEGLPLTAVVKQITVIKAVDNLGHAVNSGPAMTRATSLRMLAPLPPGQALTGQVFLDAAVRQAESLSIEGVIELALPSDANGSVIRIPNALSHGGRIENPALARQSIEFYFFPDQASYDEAKNQVADFRPSRPPDFPNGLAYFVRDPLGRLPLYQLQEANGTMIVPSGGSGGGSNNGNQHGAIRLRAPLPADAQLVLFLMIPGASKTVPFRVEDIALP